MTAFIKPSTAVGTTGAYAYRGEVISFAQNYIDNNFPNLFNINGNNTLTGSNTVQSGGTITISTGASLNLSGTVTGTGTTITLNSSSSIVNNGTTTCNGFFTSAAHAHFSSTVDFVQVVDFTNAVDFITGASLNIDYTSSFSNLGFHYDAVKLIVSTSTFYNVDTGSADYFIGCDPSGTTSGVTINLPPPVVGRRLIIKDVAGTASTTKPIRINAGAYTVDGVTGAWNDGSGNAGLYVALSSMELIAISSTAWSITNRGSHYLT